MLNKNYPPHDMNVVFDMMEEVLTVGDCHERAIEEMNLLNRLMASLPPDAVEYGMRFLHGNTDLPSSCEEIMPLYVRFLSLVEYCEKIEFLRIIPEDMTHEDIMKRSEMMESLEDHEKAFGMPLLGFTLKDGEKTPVDEDEQDEDKALHLLEFNAAVFPCTDPVRTALFYENKAGFKAAHLDDETMPHIKLTRDNTVIVLAHSDSPVVPMRQLCGVMYDMYIYVSEPLLLYNELKGSGVTIAEELKEAAESVNMKTNRQFVFEDIDGRFICVSQL